MLPDLVTLQEAKAFLRVDGADDDAVILACIRAATETARHLASGLTVEQWATPPEVVRLAIMVHVGALFDKRDNPEVPSAVLSLLQPFRSYRDVVVV